MKHDELMELLHSVERVDPPPFLLTRIEALVAERRRSLVPRSWSMAAGAFALVLVVLNVFAIGGGVERVPSDQAALQDLSATFGL
ncbi:MAG: hypothetical protein IT229_04120, partial [Flavobacteriales bacterium]|nr:hypothetical protein [Flavobacteriales bacterium]